MDTTVFHEDCAWLSDWPGVPLANEEGRLISEALGSKRAILLAHDGLLTTGRTLEEAVYGTRRFIQAVTGPRQVGKTTLVRQVIDGHHLRARFASADEPTLRGRDLPTRRRP
jgi:hypothetical protein